MQAVNWWYTTLKHGLILFNNDQRFERLIHYNAIDLYNVIKAYISSFKMGFKKLTIR